MLNIKKNRPDEISAERSVRWMLTSQFQGYEGQWPDLTRALFCGTCCLLCYYVAVRISYVNCTAPIHEQLRIDELAKKS